jgi:hypothetical protein
MTTEPVMVGGAPTAAGNKRVFLLLGVAAAMIAIALLLPKVLFASDDAALDDFDDVPVTAPADGVGAEPAEGEVEAEPVRTFEVFSTKNPFTPLIDLSPAATTALAPVAGTGTVAPATSGSTTTGSTTGSTTGGIVAPATTGSAAATEPGTSQRVALLEVFVDDASVTVASVRVNDTVHEVAQGATFAGRYQAVTLSVADGCGQFLYGDSSFRLCEGEELLK